MATASSDIPSLEPIRPRGLGDDVYDALLDMLTSGDLEPGSPLAIDRLARSLSVSPTPVREALARLEHTGLVKRAAHKGYRVASPMSPEQMEELLDARLILETGAIQRAMQDPSALLPDLEAAYRDHRTITQVLENPQAIRDRDNIHKYYAADWNFHQAILDHCGNRYIDRAVNSLSFSIHRMRQTIGRGTIDAPIALQEHADILDAVRRGDREAAVARLTSHLSNVSHRTVPENEAQ